MNAECAYLIIVLHPDTTPQREGSGLVVLCLKSHDNHIVASYGTIHMCSPSVHKYVWNCDKMPKSIFIHKASYLCPGAEILAEPPTVMFGYILRHSLT